MNMRRLCWTLLLPFLLLFAQQGELRHEYGHYAQAAKSCQKAPAAIDDCPLCLAYAHLAGAATTAIAPPTLLAGLAFHFAIEFASASVESEAASPRNRGPPLI
ncbi:MAG TPA: hypothetical protein VII31_15470 [Caldimonas sp.]